MWAYYKHTKVYVQYLKKGKSKGSCFESRLHDYPCITRYHSPRKVAPMHPTTIATTLDLCTMFPLRLGGPRQCGIQSLPDTSTHGQHLKSNPRPSTALSTWPHATTGLTKKKKKCHCKLVSLSTPKFVLNVPTTKGCSHICII